MSARRVEEMSNDGGNSRDDLRGRIMREATSMFAEEGFERTSIRGLAERCQCTKPALYYYFRNKDALFVEVVAHQVNKVKTMMESSLGGGGTLRARLNAGIHNLVAYARDDADGLRLLHRVPLHPEGTPEDAERQLNALRELHMRALVTMFEQGIRDGEVRATLSATDCAVAFAGALDYQLQRWLRDESVSLTGLESVVALLFEGMNPC